MTDHPLKFAVSRFGLVRRLVGDGEGLRVELEEVLC